MRGGAERVRDVSGPPKIMTLDTSSPEETAVLGRLIGGTVPPGTTLSLEGGLGAGKTVLVKGIAEGLGIDAEVLSPTFILVEEYRGGEFPLLHYDLYRLEQLGEVERIGMFDAIDGINVVVVEWGDRLPDGTMRFDMRIRITITGGNGRDIEVLGPAAVVERLEEWEKER